MGTILLKRFYDYKPVRLNYSNLKLGSGGWVGGGGWGSLHNPASLRLHLASWNLLDFQLS